MTTARAQYSCLKTLSAPITLIGCALVMLLATGCPLEDGTTNVNGNVLGESFSSYSGVAESFGGGYAVVLTDSGDYSCSSTPTGDYLKITIDAQQGEGTFSAAGNVSFAQVNNISEVAQPALSGTITISAIDLTSRTISGAINADGADSNASGSFDVEICD